MPDSVVAAFMVHFGTFAFGTAEPSHPIRTIKHRICVRAAKNVGHLAIDCLTAERHQASG